jgi:hypothetical protein
MLKLVGLDEPLMVVEPDDPPLSPQPASTGFAIPSSPIIGTEASINSNHSDSDLLPNMLCFTIFLPPQSLIKW